MMSRVGGIGLGLAVVLTLGGLLPAQEPKPEAKAERKAPDPSRRVPSNFGSLNLSTEQREKIYTIRGKYREQIAALRAQLDQLQAKELGECEAVLTDAQKKLLEQTRATKAQRKAPPKDEPAKPSATEKTSKSGG
jgi:Spy/CpxP family protein refolding chaperone